MRTLSALATLALLLGAGLVLSPAGSATASLGCQVVPGASYDGTRVVAASDGHHLYVFGGRNGDGSLTDAITEIGLNGTPNRVVAHLSSPRAGVAAAWNGSAFLLFGGFTSFFQGGGGTTVDIIQTFDPGSGSMQTLAARLPTARGHATAVMFAGKAFIIGGDTGQRNLDEIVAFDTDAKSVPYVYAHTGDERSGVAAALDASGTIDIFGGHGNINDDSRVVTRFVPGQNSVSSLGSDAMPRAVAGAVAFASGGSVVVLGGNTGSTALASAILYTPGQGSTDLGAKLPEARSSFGLADLGGLHYVIGGSDATHDITSIVTCGDLTPATPPPDPRDLSIQSVSPASVQLGTGWDFGGELIVTNTGNAPIDASPTHDATDLDIKVVPATRTIPAHSTVAFHVIATAPGSAALGDRTIGWSVKGQVEALMFVHVVDGGSPTATTPDGNLVPYADLSSIGVNASEGSEGDWAIHFRNPSPQTTAFPITVHAPGDWSVQATCGDGAGSTQCINEGALTIPGPNGTATLHVHSRAGAHGGLGDIIVGTTDKAANRIILGMETSSSNATRVDANASIGLGLDADHLRLAPNGTARVTVTVRNTGGADATVQLATTQATAVAGCPRDPSAPIGVISDCIATNETLVASATLGASTLFVPAGSSATTTLDVAAETATNLTGYLTVRAPQWPGANAGLYVTVAPAKVPVQLILDRTSISLAPGENASVRATLVNGDDVDLTVTFVAEAPLAPVCEARNASALPCDPLAWLVEVSTDGSTFVVPAHGSVDAHVLLSALGPVGQDGDITVLAFVPNGAGNEVLANATLHLSVVPASAVPAVTLGERIASLPTPEKAALAAGAVGVGAIIVASTRRKWPVVAAGLYARFAPSRLLEHPARRRIRALVEAQPGVTVNDAERASGLTHGAFAHHLQKLEDGGLLLSVRDGQLKRLFLPGAEPPSARAPLDERIVDLVAQRSATGGMRASELARELGTSRQAVHYHLKRLVQEGRLVAAPGGRVDLPVTSAAA